MVFMMKSIRGSLDHQKNVAQKQIMDETEIDLWNQVDQWIWEPIYECIQGDIVYRIIPLIVKKFDQRDIPDE